MVKKRQQAGMMGKNVAKIMMGGLPWEEYLTNYVQISTPTHL